VLSDGTWEPYYPSQFRKWAGLGVAQKAERRGRRRGVRRWRGEEQTGYAAPLKGGAWPAEPWSSFYELYPEASKRYARKFLRGEEAGPPEVLPLWAARRRSEMAGTGGLGSCSALMKRSDGEFQDQA
jgi:hypothetical protein